MIRPIRPGERWLHILTRIEQYKIPSPMSPHRVRARVLSYESNEVSTPAGNELADAWDSAVPQLDRSAIQSQKERVTMPIEVTGKAMDSSGRPVAGVTVRAVVPAYGDEGVEVGRATTDKDGRHTLRFGPRKDAMAEQFDDIALVEASKDGLYDKDFRDHGLFHIVSKLDHAPEPGREEVLVRPLEPATLDFTMAPAATVAARMVDAAGKPVEGATLVIEYNRRANSRDEFARVKTGADGSLEIGGLPLATIWFRVYLPHDRQYVSDPLKLREARRYEVSFTYDRSANDIKMRIVDPVATPPAKQAANSRR